VANLVLRDGEWVPETVESSGTLVFRDGEWVPDKPESEDDYGALSDIYKFFQGSQDLLTNAATGMATFGSDDDELKQRVSQYKQDREQRIEDVAGDGSDLARFAGQVAGGGVTGGPTASTGSILKGAAERIANLAVEGGMFGGMAGGNVAQDDAIGGAIAAPIEAGSAALGRFRQIPGAVRRLFGMTDEAKQADEFAKETGNIVMGEDLYQNPIIRGSGRVLDSADLSNTRVRQMEKMKETFQRDVVDPFIEFDVPLDEMEESVKRQYKAVQQKKKDLYDAAYAELNPLGPVPMESFRDELADMSVKQARQENAKELAFIDEWFNKGDVNFQDWADRRKDLGRKIRAAERSSDPDTVSLEVMRDIRSSLDSNLDAVGNQSQRYRVANDFFRENVVPYRQQAIPKKIAKGEYESALNDMLAESPTARTQKRFDEAYRALDPAGRRAMVQEILKRGMEKASSAEVPFSPAVMSTYLDKFEKRLGSEIVTPEVRKAMDGYKNLFEQSGFAGEQVARSRTGSSMAQMTGLIAAAINPKMLLTAVPSLLVRSRKFRQMMAKLGEMSPEHPDYRTLVGEITSEINREAARAGAMSE
jgi:hypothetical protein